MTRPTAKEWQEAHSDILDRLEERINITSDERRCRVAAKEILNFIKKCGPRSTPEQKTEEPTAEDWSWMYSRLSDYLLHIFHPTRSNSQQLYNEAMANVENLKPKAEPLRGRRRGEFRHDDRGYSWGTGGNAMKNNERHRTHWAPIIGPEEE